MNHIEPVTNTSTQSQVLDMKDTCGVSEGQYNQLLQMLQHNMKPTTPDSQSSFSWPSANSVHLAGTLTQSSSLDSNYIIDSGATDHITAHFSYLIDPTHCNVLLHLPNGQYIRVTHIGTVKFRTGLILHQVLCVPGFTHNLLSIPKLLKDTHLTVFFSASSCILQDPTWRRELEIGKAADGLYVLRSTVAYTSFASFNSVCFYV